MFQTKHEDRKLAFAVRRAFHSFLFSPATLTCNSSVHAGEQERVRYKMEGKVCKTFFCLALVSNTGLQSCLRFEYFTHPKPPLTISIACCGCRSCSLLLRKQLLTHSFDTPRLRQTRTTQRYTSQANDCAASNSPGLRLT